MRYRARPDQEGRPGKCDGCETIIRVPKADRNLVMEASEDIATATIVDTKGTKPFAFIRKVFGN
jgi:hypothetical protein